MTGVRVWVGRDGDGVFARGGNGLVRNMMLKAGGRWHGELRGWTFTRAAWQEFRLVYNGALEELQWADFELTEWQGRTPVVQGPRVTPNRGGRITTRSGGYSRPVGPV